MKHRLTDLSFCFFILLSPSLAKGVMWSYEFKNIPNRDLAIADWEITIDSVSGQDFTFSTGDGGTEGPAVKIEVYDKCRSDWGSRTAVGQFYPSSTVTGVGIDDSGVTSAPGVDNDITIGFTEGIEGNSFIFTDNGDDTATVEFCAEVGLYDGSTLVNFAELQLTYSMNLVTTASTLTGYSVTEAGDYTDPNPENLDFDGSLSAYFCNPNTQVKLYDNGSKTKQGTEIGICFKALDGQFEVEDILDLTVEKNTGNPSMDILSGGSVVSAAQPFIEKTCADTSTSDTNVCVVKVILPAEFYDYTAMTLTGDGSVLLELGDASRSRLLHRGQQSMGGPVGVHVQVEPYTIRFEDADEDPALSNAMIYVLAVVAIIGAVLGRKFIFGSAEQDETIDTTKADDGTAASSPATMQDILLDMEISSPNSLSGISRAVSLDRLEI